nr:uncharacterized protein LOC123767753 [Procambarus clarkii]
MKIKHIVKKLGIILVVLGLVTTWEYYINPKRKIALTENGIYTNSTNMSDSNIFHTVTKIHVNETKNTDKPVNKSLVLKLFYSSPLKASSITTENELMFVSKDDKYFEGHSFALQASSSSNVKSNRTEMYNSSVNHGKSRVSYTNSTILQSFLQKKKAESSPSLGVTKSEGALQDSWWAGRREEFARRSRIVRKVCLQFMVGHNTSAKQSLPNILPKASNDTGSYVEQVILNRFLLARSASTMTCLINKVASTSLAVSLLKADGRPVPSQWSKVLSPHNAVAVLRPQTEAEFNFARKHFFKFVLVRHPFERLLSAYRDKASQMSLLFPLTFNKHRFLQVSLHFSNY